MFTLTRSSRVILQLVQGNAPATEFQLTFARAGQATPAALLAQSLRNTGWAAAAS